MEAILYQYVGFDALLSQVRAGFQPYVRKLTHLGDIVCRIVSEYDGALIAEVCTEELAPAVQDSLQTLINGAYHAGLSLVMLIYPSGNAAFSLRGLALAES